MTEPNTKCVKCNKEFKLKWTDWSEGDVTIIVYSASSCGVYQVIVQCPHCGHQEDI